MEAHGNNLIRHQTVMFIVMILVGMAFNPMNVLAYRFSDLYLSTTLFYGGMLMASNMMWAHEIVHYISMGHFNINVFITGIVLSIMVSILLLREQYMVSDKEWLKRMISHHSTALTTSHKIKERTKDNKIKRLAEEIIETQEKEIKIMKSWL